MNTRNHFSPFLSNLQKIIFGKNEVIREILLAFLCQGHVLLKDFPGVGKTTLSLAFAKGLGLDFKRIQFTPDVMPTDLTGFSVLNRESKKFLYHPGVVFCNVLLVDEINRTSPKTHSALLEVMEEGKVTVDGITRNVPHPFFVIATQNPDQAIGTQALPEAQLDRFLVECSLGYPSYQDELKLAHELDSKPKIEKMPVSIEPWMIEAAQEEIQSIYMDPAIYEYIVRLVRETRRMETLQMGASPRATMALDKCSKASAWIQGRDYVIPQDVQEQVPYILSHRLVLGAKAYTQKRTKENIIQELLETIKVKDHD